MFRLLQFGLVFFLLQHAAPALAGDDDPFDLDEEDEDDKDDDKDDGKGKKSGGDDEIPAPIDPDDFEDDPDEDAPVKPADPDSEIRFDDDEFEEDAASATRQAGEDDSKIYREAVAKMEGLSADEEALAWEKYLKKYPNSLFKARIAARMDELNQAMYDENLGASSEGGLLDAGKAELKFAQPIMLDSIDPRTRLRVSAGFGVPAYPFGLLDYEHQILRQLSVHGGLARRYTGASVELGGKYALIKSARTNMLLTGMVDFRMNVAPVVFPALKPTVGFGKRFDVLDGLDVDVQVGSDLSFYGGGFSPRLIGGANVTLMPTETVRVYMETSTYMKDLLADPAADLHGSFRFNVVTFGLKFLWRKGKTTDLAEAGLGASVPYTSNYWAYHFGSIVLDGIYYPDLK